MSQLGQLRWELFILSCDQTGQFCVSIVKHETEMTLKVLM